jgi:hypothetical protein
LLVEHCDGAIAIATKEASAGPSFGESYATISITAAKTPWRSL